MQPLLQGKPVSITYYEGLFIATGIQHAMHMHHIVICGLYGYTVRFHIISNSMIFKKKVSEHKMCVLIFSTTFV